MILFESFCLQPLSFKYFSTPTCSSFKMAAAQGEERFFGVECPCSKFISAKMLPRDYTAEAETDLRQRLMQHAYSLNTKGHSQLPWEDVLKMQIWSYNLAWDNKQEAITRSNGSSDEETMPRDPKRARLAASPSPSISSPRPASSFNRLDRHEKLNELHKILERVEEKLDEVHDVVALLNLGSHA